MEKKKQAFEDAQAKEKCNCYKCDLANKCPYKNKFQRLPRSEGGLGLCKKLR